MGDHEKVDEQVEDLDTPESEAEEVKGGLNFTSVAHKGELSANKVGAKVELGGIKQSLDGWGSNHSETLIAI